MLGWDYPGLSNVGQMKWQASQRWRKCEEGSRINVVMWCETHCTITAFEDGRRLQVKKCGHILETVEPPQRNTTLQTLDFIPVRFLSYLWYQEFKIIHGIV